MNCCFFLCCVSKQYVHIHMCVSVCVRVCSYNRNQDRYCTNELFDLRQKTYFLSKTTEKDKVTTSCVPELETQATCSI